MAATVLSMLIPVRAEPPPAQSERETLAAAINVLKQVCTEAERAAEPVTRLEAAVRGVTAIDAALKSLRQADQARLGDWIVGDCEGPRPEPAPQTPAVEREPRRRGRRCGSRAGA